MERKELAEGLLGGGGEGEVEMGGGVGIYATQK